MLVGDEAKYLGMVFGVAFATLLLSQQSSIFTGLVGRAATTVSDVRDADVWVMDPRVRSVEGPWPMPETALWRVRGVAGVAWAAPLLKTTTTLIVPDGSLQTAGLIGVDDASLAGLPPTMLAGRRDDLRAAGAVLMDGAGWQFLFGQRPFEPGTTLQINDTRAVIVGLVDAGAQFSTQVTLYTRYTTAVSLAPGGRARLSFVIARAAPGLSPDEVAARITAQTSLKAASSTAFARETSDDVIGNTGIPISIGVVVALGIVVGIVVVALTFSLFIRDNLRQFGALKAIGVSNVRLLGMVAVQGAMVGAAGYGVGIGLAAFIIDSGARNALALRGFTLPWQVAGLAGLAVTLIIGVAGVTSIRRVLVTDPASVFRS